MPDVLNLVMMMAGALPAPGAKTWRKDMERAIEAGHLAAWLAGSAERLNVPVGSKLLNRKNLSRVERAEIKAAIAAQLPYLERFDRERANLTDGQIRVREQLYAKAIQATYHRARWGDWDIPWVPGDGSTECLGNCLCSVNLVDNGDGTGVYTWTLGKGASEQHCDTCPGREGDHVVKRKGYATKTLFGFPIIETNAMPDATVLFGDWTALVSVPIGAAAQKMAAFGPIAIQTERGPRDWVKHMPGAHDQRSHGRSTGRRRAVQAAYRGARAGGATVAEARAFAKQVSRFGAVEQRLKNIQVQLGGHISDAERSSLQAERSRLLKEKGGLMLELSRSKHVDAWQDAYNQMGDMGPTVTGRKKPVTKKPPVEPAKPPATSGDDTGPAPAKQKGPFADDGSWTPSPEAKAALERTLGAEERVRSQLQKYDMRISAMNDALTAKKLERDRYYKEYKDMDMQSGIPIRERLEKKAAWLRAAKDTEALKGKIDKVFEQRDETLASEGRKSFFVSKDQQKPTFGVPLGRVSDTALTRIHKGFDAAAQITTHAGAPPGHGIHVSTGTKNTRAYALEYSSSRTLVSHGPDTKVKGLIHVSPTTPQRTVIHEYGHHVEFTNPQVKQRANAWLDRRTAGETPQKLSAVTGNKGYRSDEVTTPDKFVSPYIGKRYKDQSTEVISMGLEMAWTTPVALAKSDPDMFMFIYDVTRN